MQPLDTDFPKQEVVDGIEIGDQIELETKTGDRRVITVSSISKSHIESGTERFALEEIEIVGLRKTTAAEEGAGVAFGITIGVSVHVLLMALILGLAF